MKRLQPASDFPLPPQHPGGRPRSIKTRELPNLSNCHCCNYRINSTNPNPKNRLRTLASEWRVVLLCNSCYTLVESSQVCAYCLTNIGSSDFFECRVCRHRVHSECVSMFGGGNGGGDKSVCFDCWVPGLVEIRHRKRPRKESRVCGDSVSFEGSRVCDEGDECVRVCDERDNKEGRKCLEEMVNDCVRVCGIRPRGRPRKESRVCGESMSLESSRVCDWQGDKAGKCLEDMVNDCVRVCEIRPRGRGRPRKESRVCGDSMSLESFRVCDEGGKEGGKLLEEMVNEANVVARRKIAVAFEAKEKAVAKAAVARRAVELAGGALSFVSGEKNGGNYGGGGVVEDDAQLAIQLHRAMNSSPRISRNSCLLDSGPFGGCTVNGIARSEVLRSQVEVKTCLSEGIKVGSEADVGDLDSISRKEESGFWSVETGQESVQNVDERDDQKSNVGSDSSDCLITYSRKRAASSQNGRSSKESKGLLRMYRRRLSHLEKRIADRGHCLKTYRRRVTGLHNAPLEKQTGR